MSAYRQMPLAFDHRPALSGEDFLVAPGNAEAVAWIDRWPDWPMPALILFGAAGCGKTHLGQVFLGLSEGRTITPEQLARTEPPRLLKGTSTCLLDDAAAFLDSGLEEPLLHLYNIAEETGSRMMLTARRSPACWRVALADLRSRLNAAPAIGIEPPDDTLIAAVIVKLFSDRQLRIDGEIIDYMLVRMERSFEAARRLVAAIDARSLASHRNITVPLVRQVLSEFGKEQQEI
ncbi:MAG TPA: DnaA/Hda family protein [Rhodospirillales bacterium]|nr:DnaA/Hda family protein [Rhodospirillales bacterium]